MDIDSIIKKFTPEFLGKAGHKTTPEKFFSIDSGVLLDVRSKLEFDSLSFGLKHHKNIESINIPLNELPERLSELPKDRTIGIWCPGNSRSAIAYTYLLTKGFENVFILTGGYSGISDNLTLGKLLKL